MEELYTCFTTVVKLCYCVVCGYERTNKKDSFSFTSRGCISSKRETKTDQEATLFTTVFINNSST